MAGKPVFGFVQEIQALEIQQASDGLQPLGARLHIQTQIVIAVPQRLHDKGYDRPAADQADGRHGQPELSRTDRRGGGHQELCTTNSKSVRSPEGVDRSVEYFNCTSFTPANRSSWPW